MLFVESVSENGMEKKLKKQTMPVNLKHKIMKEKTLSAPQKYMNMIQIYLLLS